MKKQASLRKYIVSFTPTDLDFINGCLEAERTPEAIAQELGINPSTLSQKYSSTPGHNRKFKGILGESRRGYERELRRKGKKPKEFPLAKIQNDASHETVLLLGMNHCSMRITDLVAKLTQVFRYDFRWSDIITQLERGGAFEGNSSLITQRENVLILNPNTPDFRGYFDALCNPTQTNYGLHLLPRDRLEMLFKTFPKMSEPARSYRTKYINFRKTG